MKKTIVLTLAATIVAGCAARHKAQPAQEVAVTGIPAVTESRSPAAYIPKAVVYKTNGNFDNNVPVSLTDSGDGLLSFPGPGDVSAASAPVKLVDGWLLDRRGIGKNTAFLRYTYADYAALKQVPTVKALMSEIIPGARVTEVKTLPMTLQQALDDINAVNKYLEGL